MSQPRIQKRHRELLRQLAPTFEELGATLIELDVRGSGHVRLKIDFGHGAIGYLTVSNSPSCSRTQGNVRRDLFRIHREKCGSRPN